MKTNPTHLASSAYALIALLLVFGTQLSAQCDPPLFNPPKPSFVSPNGATGIPDGVAGFAYEPIPICIQGGTAPYTVLVVSTTQPPSGLTVTKTLDSMWWILGTPTEASPPEGVTFRLQIVDANDNESIKLTLNTVIHPAPTLENTVLDVAVEGEPYQGSVPLTATGGIQPTTITQVAGLPAGLSFNPDGFLQGTPEDGTAQDDPYNVFVIIEDSGDTPAASLITVPLFVLQPLTFSTATLPPAQAFEEYPPTALNVEGGTAPYTYLSALGLPTGLSLSENGIIQGMPICDIFSLDTYEIEIEVLDSSTPTPLLRTLTGLSIEPEASLGLEGAISIETDSLPIVEEGQAYNVKLESNNGFGGIKWDVDGLPSGLFSGFIDGAWRIMGAPHGGSAGTYSITLYAQDQCESPQQAVKPGVVLKVIKNDPSLSLTILTTALSFAQVGETYGTEYLDAAGGTKPYSFSAIGLPPGITLGQSDLGENWFLSGSPSTPGNFDITLTLEDASGASQSVNLKLDIVDAPTEESNLPSSATPAFSSLTSAAAGSCNVNTSTGWLPFALLTLISILARMITRTSKH